MPVLPIESFKESFTKVFRQLLLKNRRSLPAELLGKTALKIYRAYENYNYSFRENGEYDVIHKLKPNDLKVIFDVGANEGHWSRMASEEFPDSDIHAFEIVQPTFERLEENIKTSANVIPHDFGLSDSEGDLTLLHSPAPEESALASIYHDSLNHLHDHINHVPISGKVVTGKDFCDEKGIQSIDFLKIDTEGSEHLVLHGFEPMFTQKKIDVIQFEYGCINIESKFLLRDYYNFFNEKGYLVGKIYPDYVDFRDYNMQKDENFIGPNYLAVNAELEDYIDILKN